MALQIDREKDEAFVEKVRQDKSPVIGVMPPDWRGIRSSLENHLDHCYYLEDSVTSENVGYFSDLFFRTGCRKIVYGALPLTYAPLMRQIRADFPSLNQYITWHGSFLQSNEPYNWESFKGALCLAREGSIRKIGFVKKGMEEITRKVGVSTAFYSNFVDSIPEGPSIPLENGPHLGLWAIAPIWRKNPFAMLAATSQVESAIVHIHGQDAQCKEFAELFAIRHKFDAEPLAMQEMPRALSEMHLNLYVTLSECAPMTPLESLSVGVPCLLGPNSHYFEDWKSLFDALVVPFPDKASVIADYIENALANRREIVTDYARFATQYNQRARDEFASFIDL
jgi:glycosyltransferase involved in cell wall biosynthesis